MALTRRVNAIAVIGANYGDEGKGAVVNHLSRIHRPEYVIRFNGGGQAGHTVQLRDGTRHVFSTFGSGTFYGAKTYYTEDVLVSPRRLWEEKAQLLLLDVRPIVHIHQDARIITDWDIAANQFGEMFRRDANLPHGTCGMGIGECVRRHLEGGPPSRYATYPEPPPGEYREWFMERIRTLGKETGADLKKYNLQLVEAMARMGELSSTCPSPTDLYTGPEFSSITPTVIFEGAQGLLLDEDDPDHQPHVTWSKTGLTNVIKECKKYGWHLSEVHYVTRPYLTRHGVGPMHAADPDGTIGWIDGKQPADLTNVDNKWQGGLRYAAMDWRKFEARVNKDFQLALDAWPEDPPQMNLAVTCSDQMRGWNPLNLNLKASDANGGWITLLNGLEG